MSHPNSKSKTSLATLFPFSMRDLIVTALILFVAVTFCILLQRLDPSAGFATPVFVLTVLLTSRLTTGYFWGLFSAVLGVIAVNFFFTFPYWAFNLTITGYPLSFLTFLSVSVITSALTTKTRQLDKLRMENEKIRMRADLLRSVSHDIRTPLTSIIGSTSAVLDNPNLSQEDRRSLLEDVKQEAQWLIRTVENLLSITRIGDNGGSASIDKQEEMVEEIVGSAVLKFRKRYPDVEVAVRLPEDPLLVPMDGILIEQVLVNLINNAIKYTPEHSRIELFAAPEGKFVRICVTDDGPGIPEESRDKLFDMFYTLGKTRSDGRRGLGLGLALCRSIVAAHGGVINVQNAAPHGACFRFTLPRTEVTLYE